MKKEPDVGSPGGWSCEGAGVESPRGIHVPDETCPTLPSPMSKPTTSVLYRNGSGSVSLLRYGDMDRCMRALCAQRRMKVRAHVPYSLPPLRPCPDSRSTCHNHRIRAIAHTHVRITSGSEGSVPTHLDPKRKHDHNDQHEQEPKEHRIEIAPCTPPTTRWPLSKWRRPPHWSRQCTYTRVSPVDPSDHPSHGSLSEFGMYTGPGSTIDAPGQLRAWRSDDQMCLPRLQQSSRLSTMSEVRIFSYALRNGSSSHSGPPRAVWLCRRVVALMPGQQDRMSASPLTYCSRLVVLHEMLVERHTDETGRRISRQFHPTSRRWRWTHNLPLIDARARFSVLLQGTNSSAINPLSSHSSEAYTPHSSKAPSPRRGHRRPCLRPCRSSVAILISHYAAILLS